jgi:4-amino-4-deoxy-L-arabinose transferase-like glycosyltransferase
MAYAANGLRSTPAVANLTRVLPLVCGSVFIVLALVIGVPARFIGLNALTLAVDEYYYVRGVDFILEHGVPLFPTGGYYVHGPLMQYLIAGSVLIFGPTGFGYRLPSVIFSLASVWLFYIYARRFFDRAPAGLLAAILLLSAWHIEFARFARMYSALQCLTLAFLIVYAKAFFDRNSRWTYAPHAVSFPLVLSQELGLLLLPLLFVPLCLKELRQQFRDRAAVVSYATITLLTISVCVWYGKIDFMRMGVTDPFPPGYAPPVGSSLRLPVFPFWGISESAFWNLALFLGLSGAVVILLSIWRRFGRKIQDTDLIAALLLVSSIFHLFTVSILLGIVLLARYRIYRVSIHPVRVYAILVLAAAISLFWVGVALTSSDWLSLVPGSGRSWLKAFARTFFGWPDFYIPVVAPWRRELPILGFLSLLALTYHLFLRARDPLPVIVRHPAFVVAWIVVCVGVFNSYYTSTRYFFYIYPLVLLTIALAILELLRTSGRLNQSLPDSFKQYPAMLGFLILFACTEDFNLDYLKNISNESVKYRTGEFQRYALTWYPRSDYATPAAFVNDFAARHGETKTVVLGQPAVSYYLNVPHALYYGRNEKRFFNVSRVAGTVDKWSNQRLLSTEEEVRNYTLAAENVLVIRSASEKRQTLDVASTWAGRMLDSATVFKGLDARVEVLLVKLPRR